MIDIEKNTIINGNSLEVLKSLPDNSIDCCVTSPPYYALRDYGVDGQIGLEETPEAYINRLSDVFMEVYRVLKPEGTLWLNIADSYYNYRPRKRCYVQTNSIKYDSRPSTVLPKTSQ